MSTNIGIQPLTIDSLAVSAASITSLSSVLTAGSSLSPFRSNEYLARNSGPGTIPERLGLKPRIVLDLYAAVLDTLNHALASGSTYSADDVLHMDVLQLRENFPSEGTLVSYIVIQRQSLHEFQLRVIEGEV